MEEKIYTIPVMDAFNEDCECPFCLLEKRLEEQYIDDLLNNSVMDVPTRLETNEKGFCRKHYELMYNQKFTKLPLAVIINSHMIEQNTKMRKILKGHGGSDSNNNGPSIVKMAANKILSKFSSNNSIIDEIISELSSQQNKCTICSRIDYSMERYIDVTFHLWFKEKDFKELFSSKKGFCRKHFIDLLDGIKKYNGYRGWNELLDIMLKMEIENLERVQGEVDWFIKKIDYTNKDAPWGNSRDAVARGIQKTVGLCNLTKND